MASDGRSAGKARKPAAKSAGSGAKKAPAAKKAARPPAKRSTAEAPAAAKPKPPTAPAGLGPTGGKLWRSVLDDFELRPDELRILEDACREAALIDKLQHEIDQLTTLIARGSMGQPVANPLIQEVRQHRATFAQLMARLKLADADGEGSPGDRSARARAAATARWRRGT